MTEDYVGTESDPRAALVWLTEQRATAVRKSADPEVYARRRGWHTRDDFEFNAACSWETLTRLTARPAGSGVAVREGRSVEIYAHPMTSSRCRSTHG